jgi:hypothetical protein
LALVNCSASLERYHARRGYSPFIVVDVPAAQSEAVAAALAVFTS